MTPRVKIDRSRLAVAKPKTNPVPAAYDNPIAAQLAAEEARKSLALSFDERYAFRRRVRLTKYNGGAR